MQAEDLRVLHHLAFSAASSVPKANLSCSFLLLVEAAIVAIPSVLHCPGNLEAHRILFHANPPFYRGPAEEQSQSQSCSFLECNLKF